MFYWSLFYKINRRYFALVTHLGKCDNTREAKLTRNNNKANKLKQDLDKPRSSISKFLLVFVPSWGCVADFLSLLYQPIT